MHPRGTQIALPLTASRPPKKRVVCVHRGTNSRGQPPLNLPYSYIATVNGKLASADQLKVVVVVANHSGVVSDAKL